MLVTARDPPARMRGAGELPGAPVTPTESTLPKRVRKDKVGTHTGRWCDHVLDIGSQ